MTEQKPMSTEDKQKAADEARKNYDQALEQMSDRRIADRVKAAHPNAVGNADALKVMQEDYERLKGEADKETNQSAG